MLLLGLFHALGKVLYAKRGPEPETEPLPAHLEKHRRNNLQAVPEQVFEKACIREETEFFNIEVVKFKTLKDKTILSNENDFISTYVSREEGKHSYSLRG